MNGLELPLHHIEVNVQLVLRLCLLPEMKEHPSVVAALDAVLSWLHLVIELCVEVGNVFHRVSTFVQAVLEYDLFSGFSVDEAFLLILRV